MIRKNNQKISFFIEAALNSKNTSFIESNFISKAHPTPFPVSKKLSLKLSRWDFFFFFTLSLLIISSIELKKFQLEIISKRNVNLREMIKQLYFD